MRHSPLAEFPAPVRRALPWLVGFRLVSNSAVRFPFTFLPALARGSGLSVEALSLVLSLRDLTAMAAPSVGRVADRRNSTFVMGVASAAVVLGLGLSSLGAIGLVIGFFLLGFAKLIFDISMNAWVGDNVAYERRGRVIGLIELSWAGSALIGLPILGLLINGVGWWAATAFLCLVGLPLVAGIARQAQGGPIAGAAEREVRRPTANRMVVVSLAAFAAMALGSQFMLIGHGLWLEDTYGFDPARIGFAAMTIGVIEAVASTASSSVTDRWGKKNSVIAGTALLTLAMGMLASNPDPPIPQGLALLALAFLGFEFALVSSISMTTELDPEARAQVMGWSLGLSTVTRAAGSVVGAWIYLEHGFSWLMATGASASALCVAILVFLGLEPPTPDADIDGTTRVG